MRIIINVPEDDATTYVREVARQLEDEFTNGHVDRETNWTTEPTPEDCEGHESTDGPIGNVTYCDGTCKSKGARS